MHFVRPEIACVLRLEHSLPPLVVPVIITGSEGPKGCAQEDGSPSLYEFQHRFNPLAGDRIQGVKCLTERDRDSAV